jgi:hypothetical protein
MSRASRVSRLSDPILNILVAYPYMKANVVRELESAKDRIRFVLDSGAFTAWKAGREIPLDDYCQFIEKLPFKPWRYFTLDKIGDPDGTMKNYETMLSRGFKPVPIFTRGENPALLEKYYETSDVVGIGGLVGTLGNKSFVKGIMELVGPRKVHWLGFNAAEFIPFYKPYMCDSSSWSSSFRYASARVYCGNGAWMPFTKKDFARKPDEKLLSVIREHSVDPRRLARDDEWSNGNKEREYAIETLTHRTWVKYQQDLELKLGTKFFLACSTDGQVRLMTRAFDFWATRRRP